MVQKDAVSKLFCSKSVHARFFGHQSLPSITHMCVSNGENALLSVSKNAFHACAKNVVHFKSPLEGGPEGRSLKVLKVGPRLAGRSLGRLVPQAGTAGRPVREQDGPCKTRK